VLAAVSGSIDAIGFVALGGAFSSVMTGNLVICGVALAHGDGQLLLLVAAAVVAYVVGVGLGARIAGAPPPVHVREHWPAAVTQTLLVEMGLFVVFAIGWWSAGSRPGEHVEVVLLALNAMALGMQSAAVTRFGVAGLSSTYLTGTLTTLVLRLVHREPLGAVRLNAQLLAALVAGGAGGAALAFHARTAAPALPLVLLTLALLGARRLPPSRS
jgi:uncharacterized membrane protein YoaK (UPF0700 family)